MSSPIKLNLHKILFGPFDQCRNPHHVLPAGKMPVLLQGGLQLGDSTCSWGFSVTLRSKTNQQLREKSARVRSRPQIIPDKINSTVTPAAFEESMTQPSAHDNSWLLKSELVTQRREIFMQLQNLRAPWWGSSSEEAVSLCKPDSAEEMDLKPVQGFHSVPVHGYGCESNSYAALWKLITPDKTPRGETDNIRDFVCSPALIDIGALCCCFTCPNICLDK